MSQKQVKPLSPIKWALGIAAFVAVIAGSIMLGNWLGPQRNTTLPVPVGSPAVLIVFLIVGGVVFVIGLVAYAIVLATHCFTFNFDRPFFPAYRGKMWFVNLVVGLFLQGGFGLMMFPTAARLLAPILPAPIVLPVGFFLPFIVAQLIMVWFIPWAPLDRAMIRRRMEAIGFLPQQLEDGLLMGISDPSRSSLKKLTRIEDDVGVLWFAPDALVYRGDQQALYITRAAVQEVERKADAGATSAYFGAVHVIVRYLDDAGAQRRVRLHPEVNWTMTAAARAQNELAERIESWRLSADAQATPGALASATGGFPVTMLMPAPPLSMPLPPPPPLPQRPSE